MKRILAAAALLLALGGSAFAQERGYVTTNVNLRAGPGTVYPVVVILEGGTPLGIYGCIDDYSWCDVDWRGYRGWIAAQYLGYDYRGRRVDFYDYAPTIGVPIVAFSFGDYWGRYYRGRPWYSTYDRWGPPPPRGYGGPPHGGPGYGPPPPGYGHGGWNNGGWNNGRPPQGGGNWGGPPPGGGPGWNNGGWNNGGGRPPQGQPPQPRPPQGGPPPQAQPPQQRPPRAQPPAAPPPQQQQRPPRNQPQGQPQQRQPRGSSPCERNPNMAMCDR
ncbi:SH3 domain-containing protein [Ancylobacter sp. VNQ12]|uniref:SH3 domain-containing protein n=1 Tax=Ancylobacter sp. VNQ12 TaxID=3400920 RepID=UPI003BFF3E9B